MTETVDKAKRAKYRISRLVGWKYSGNITLAAEKMNVSYWTLYRVCKGDTVPSANFLATVAHHFEITVDVLLADDERDKVAGRPRNFGKGPTKY